MIEYGAPIVFSAPQPRCPEHGQMHHRFAVCQWECRGYDGEGCAYTVTDEEALRSMEPIGVVTEMPRSGDGPFPQY